MTIASIKAALEDLIIEGPATPEMVAHNEAVQLTIHTVTSLPALEKPVGEWTASLLGGYPKITWAEDYRAVIGEKLYASPVLGKQIPERSSALAAGLLAGIASRNSQEYEELLAPVICLLLENQTKNCLRKQAGISHET